MKKKLIDDLFRFTINIYIFPGHIRFCCIKGGISRDFQSRVFQQNTSSCHMKGIIFKGLSIF